MRIAAIISIDIDRDHAAANFAAKHADASVAFGPKRDLGLGRGAAFVTRLPL